MLAGGPCPPQAENFGVLGNILLRKHILECTRKRVFSVKRSPNPLKFSPAAQKNPICQTNFVKLTSLIFSQSTRPGLTISFFLCAPLGGLRGGGGGGGGRQILRRHFGGCIGYF